MRVYVMIVAVGSMLPLAVLAQSRDKPSPASITAYAGRGQQTQVWLDAQTSGTLSVVEQRPMPGEVATIMYNRYLRSFTYPIPLRYTSQEFSTVGGPSGGGGGGGGAP